MQHVRTRVTINPELKVAQGFKWKSIHSTYEEISDFSKLFHSDGHTEWNNNGLGSVSIYLDYAELLIS